MYDAALYYRDHARKPPWFEQLPIGTNEFVLCTIHRAENTENRVRMQGILAGLDGAALPVILPLHPRTRNKLQQMNLQPPANVRVVAPVGYLEMIWLEVYCKLIATDSVGVQKEAYFHQKPCVTLRDETEWVELVDEGFNQIVGADAGKIAHALSESSTAAFSKLIYGDGRSAIKLIEKLGLAGE